MAFDTGAGAISAVNFLGLNFTPFDRDAALDVITARATLAAPFAYVTTPNVDHMVKLSREPARRALYEHAWLTLNDSRILELLSARAGLYLPSAPGADLAEMLFARVIDKDEAVTIIGGDRQAIAALRRRFGLTDIRWHNAPAGLASNPQAIVEAAAFAAAHGARFTFICVGAPQQEMVAYAISQIEGATGVGLCVGAALDFLSGKTARAPAWMRALRLEWLHRLISEPKRLWKRYLVDGPRIFSLFAAWRATMAAASAA
ncbi:MAG: WecB/TagA/CpsF family glycosyltransferase [Hyphomonadaceae bacterium]|nr:WecB/TagA/CpsF family glycosyltransferase [Hyphomonadaceae bacterium]